MEEVMPLSHRPVWIACPTATEKDFHFRNHRICVYWARQQRDRIRVQCAEDIASRAAADLVLLHVVPESTEALLHQATDGVSYRSQEAPRNSLIALPAAWEQVQPHR